MNTSKNKCPFTSLPTYRTVEGKILESVQAAYKQHHVRGKDGELRNMPILI